MNFEGDRNGLEFLPDHDRGGPGVDDDFPINSADAIADAWDAIESGIFGDLGGGINVGVCSDEEDMDSPYQSSEAHNFPQVSGFSLAGKGRLSVGISMVSEFETTAQKVAYLLIHEGVMNCFQNSASKQKQSEAMEWVFCGESDGFGRTFKACCDVLNVREWLLQTRLQFQFFAKGMTFAKPFTEEILNLPSIMEAESVYYGNYEGAILCSIAWCHPGITHQELIKESKASAKAVHLLEERGLMSETKGCWYATGRNPMLKEYVKQSISWSGLWPDGA